MVPSNSALAADRKKPRPLKSPLNRNSTKERNKFFVEKDKEFLEEVRDKEGALFWDRKARFTYYLLSLPFALFGGAIVSYRPEVIQTKPSLGATTILTQGVPAGKIKCYIGDIFFEKFHLQNRSFFA